MDAGDRFYVEKLYVSIKKLRPLVRAILLFDRELGAKLSKHVDAIEIELRSVL